MLVRDALTGVRGYGNTGAVLSKRHNTWNQFWQEIHYALAYRHGRPMLVPSQDTLSPDEDTLQFLSTCSDEEYLDFIELIFKTKTIANVCGNENLLIDEINALIQTENVEYELTHIAFTPLFNSDTRIFFQDPFGHAPQNPISNVIAFPQIILKEDQVIHSEIIRPVLNLLSDVRFANANKEYLEALDDYRKDDFGGCLTMCGTALESVLKIICVQKNWIFDTGATAEQLIQNVVTRSNLAAYFKTTLMSVPTLRNKLGKEHGAGTVAKVVPRHFARYAINECASAIIFLVEATTD